MQLDLATPELTALIRALKDRSGLHRAMANGGRIAVQDHFAKFAMGNRNRFGRPSTFWRRMRGATQAESSAQSAAVVMEREVALRRFGGTIRPTGPRKALTIPVNPRAYNRKAASFDGLFVVKFKKGTRQGGGKGSVFLARKGRKGALELMYLLTPKATIKPNADVLPTDAALAAAVKEAATQYLQRRTAVRAS